MKPGIMLVAFSLAVSPGQLGSVHGQTSPVARDWPQWRGADRTAVSKETGLMKTWPKDGPPLLWQATGLGKGYSSVAIVGDRIFTMGDRGEVQYVIALDRATRGEVWATKVSARWRDGSYGTPTVCDCLVFALGTHGNLVCLDKGTGAVRWRRNVAEEFGGRVMNDFGYAESPLVDGDRLVCTPGGPEAALIAVNKITGELIWKSRPAKLGPKGLDGAGSSSIVVGEPAGVRQYVQLLGRGIVGVAVDDGRFLWGYNRIANGFASVTTPVLHGNDVFCTTSYQTGSALLTLTATSERGVRAEEAYFVGPRDFGNHHGGVVLVDGHIYGGHGKNRGYPTCVNLRTGKVAWKQEPGPGRGSAAVVYADGHLYFRYDNGVMALIEATPEGYRLKGTFELPELPGPGWAHPVILDGQLYLRHDDVLLCYGLKAGPATQPGDPDP